MCGRTACTLSKQQLQQACNVPNNVYKQLDWEDCENGGKTYVPSYNLCPTDISPVIVLNKYDERVLKPMVWGMIPPWHKGQFNNHRIGKRCVVICDGFYEWQSKTKQPYFIYNGNNSSADPETWKLSDWSATTGWQGPRLLQLAGLYNQWISPQGAEYFSYSIVTMESNEKFSWLHHRIPAVLDSDHAIESWLAKNSTPPNKVLSNLIPDVNIAWHPVSNRVNNSRDKSHGLNAPIKLEEKKLSKSAAMMANWLKRKSPENDEKSNETNKRKPNSNISRPIRNSQKNLIG